MLREMNLSDFPADYFSGKQSVPIPPLMTVLTQTNDADYLNDAGYFYGK
jgi:hypothetical protein